MRRSRYGATNARVRRPGYAATNAGGEKAFSPQHLYIATHHSIDAIVKKTGGNKLDKGSRSIFDVIQADF